ncbi:MAG: hypothetical protein OHK0046_25140 [Anaerolineae bacterium]
MDLIPAYSMGATDADETRLVESMLDDCPEARLELEQYQALAAGMLHIIPMDQDPAPVEALMARIEAEQPLPQTWTPAQIPPQHDATTSVNRDVLPFPAAQAAAPARPSAQRRSWLMPAALVASVALLITLNLYWLLQFQELQREQRQLTELLVQQQAITPVSNTVLSVGTGDQHHRQLTATQAGGDAATANITWVSGTEIGSLFVDGLPPLPNGQTYQLWLENDTETVSLGTFTVNPDGSGALIFQSPEPIVEFQRIGISVEDAAGSSTRPTTPHVVVGQI